MLESAGSSLKDVVKVNIFLADMADFGKVNEVYAATFPDPKPVCALFSWFVELSGMLDVLTLLGADVCCGQDAAHGDGCGD